MDWDTVIAESQSNDLILHIVDQGMRKCYENKKNLEMKGKIRDLYSTEVFTSFTKKKTYIYVGMFLPRTAMQVPYNSPIQRWSKLCRDMRYSHAKRYYRYVPNQLRKSF